MPCLIIVLKIWKLIRDDKICVSREDVLRTRTAISLLGGVTFGSGLFKVFSTNYKEASIMLMISSGIYFIGYVIEMYNSEENWRK